MVRNKTILYFVSSIFSILMFSFFTANSVLADTNIVTNGDFSVGDSTGWTIIENGGTGAGFGGAYATSYSWCSISQTVDLLAAGYSADQLDAAPDIDFNVQTFQRFDHDGYYYLEYKLLAENGSTVIDSQLYGSAGSPIYLTANTDWFDTNYTFSSYGAGARYAYIKIAGQDGSPDWGGQYGPYFDNVSIALADTTNPTATLSPIDDSTGVSIDSNLVMTFDEAVDAESGNITIYKTSDNSTVETFDVTADISGSGSTEITVNPSSDLSYETEYYVFVDATAFDDAAGNSYAGITASSTWSFTTEDSPVCPTVENAATYNPYPICGPATCNLGYILSGSSCSAASASTGVSIYEVGRLPENIMRELGLLKEEDDVEIVEAPEENAEELSEEEQLTEDNKDNDKVSDFYLDDYEGKLVKYLDDPKVYLIENNKKRWIRTSEDFNGLGYSWEEIVILEDIIFNDGFDIFIEPGEEKFYFSNFLEFGMENDEIKKLQETLKGLGYFNLEYTTNYFGAITEEAVVQFQIDNGIVDSRESYGAGYVGPKTIKALNSF
jgi:hypothetical protein